VAVGYTCDANVTPCTPTQGVVNVVFARCVSDLGAAGHGGRDGMGGRGEPFGWRGGGRRGAHQGQGLSGSGVGSWAGKPSWEYQGTLSTLQVATGIAVGPYGYISVGGFFLDGEHARRRGRHPAPLLAGHEHAASVQGEQRGLVEGFAEVLEGQVLEDAVRERRDEVAEPDKSGSGCGTQSSPR
jgi:hypothetical protein